VRPEGLLAVLQIVSAVIATDVGAYFAGRTLGGPKIAPKISPSKTWAGLIGGMIAAGLVFVGWAMYVQALHPWTFAVNGAVAAIIAQAGDFFESWMKRRAGVKDSGRLIPGHGGLFDRLDGLLAVSFVLGILLLLSSGFKGIS
jgi:phosphatidate cytidylyltransferase